MPSEGNHNAYWSARVVAGPQTPSTAIWVGPVASQPGGSRPGLVCGAAVMLAAWRAGPVPAAAGRMGQRAREQRGQGRHRPDWRCAVMRPACPPVAVVDSHFVPLLRSRGQQWAAGPDPEPTCVEVQVWAAVYQSAAFRCRLMSCPAPGST